MREIKKIITILIVLISLVGCSKEKVDIQENINYDYNELVQFLPSYPFSWEYEGNGNYYHIMSLEKVNKLEKSIIYKVVGEIYSEASDDSFNDYSLNIRYILNGNGLRQEKNEKKMLDSKYDSLYILKFPISEGNTWYEIVIDEEGNKNKLKSSIVGITKKGNIKNIKVLYEEQGSDYFEERIIESGKGIIEFKKNMEYNKTNYEVGYKLIDYKKGIKSDKEQLQESINNALINFNIAWEDFYNNNNESIYNLIGEGSQLMKSVKAFSNNGKIKIDFIDLEIKGINKIDNRYNVLVEETYVKKLKDQSMKDTSIIEYQLIKKENKFYIENHRKITN